MSDGRDTGTALPGAGEPLSSFRARAEAERIANVGYWHLDLQRNTLTWSDEIFRIFELDPKQFSPSYEAFLAAIHPEDREYVNRVYAESVKGRVPYDIVHRLLMRDGRVKYVNERCETFYDAAGQPERSIGTVQDITERRQSEDALRRTVDELHEAQRVARVGSWHLDAATNQVAWTEELYRMLGLDPGLPPPPYNEHQRLFTPESWEKLSAAVPRALELGIPYQLELEITRADGSRGWMLARGEPERDANGRIVGARGTAQDITDRVERDEDLHRFRAAMDASGDAIVLVDRESMRYVDFNQTFCDLLGYAREELLGRSPMDVFSTDRATLRRDYDDIVANKGSVATKIEGHYRRKDGTLVPVESRRRALRTKDGWIIVATARDISERKRAEESLRARELELRLVIDSVPAMIAYTDAQRRFRYANRRYRKFFLQSEAPVEGKPLDEVIGEEALRVAGPQIDHAYAGETINYQSRRQRRDGRIRVIDITLVPNLAGDGRVLGVYFLALDVTRRQRAEQMLRLRSRAIEASVNTVVITQPVDRGQSITYVNPAFERVTGYAADEVLGRSPRFLHGDDLAQPAIEELRAALRGQSDATVLLRNYRKDGTLFWNELRVAPVRDEDGRVTHYIGIGSDVTDRVRYEGEIERNANFDALTGLPNRNLLGDRLAQAVANVERTRSPAAVLYIDLDQFKRINDSLGHDVGDQVIAATGARLAAALRSGDTVARWGGDEFVAVLTNLGHEDDVTHVAEKLRRAVAAPLTVERHEFVLSASIGIAIAPKDGNDGPKLLRNADAALFRAKEQGRDCFRFFAAEMNEHAVRYLSMEHDLRSALNAGEFWLQYQPIVRFSSGQAVGVEALIRWRRPDGSVVPPGDFIPVAEESGLIVPIGRWVLETAARQAAAWRRARQAQLYVSVNLSARQFRDPGLVDMVRAALEQARLDPSLLKLEITESTVMQNAEEAVRTLHGLNSLGVLLSVDDFGTGYSSLSYLKRFPIDTLKIDRSFVRDLPADRDDLAICRAVVDMAQGLGLEVIAEGIETPEQAALLSAQGCQFAQGYLFSRPVNPEAVEELVRNRLPAPSPSPPGA